MAEKLFSNLIHKWVSKIIPLDVSLAMCGFYPISSERGFLPLKNPLIDIPGHTELAILLNKMVNDLPALLKKKCLRKEIDLLNATHANTKLLFNEENAQEKYIVLVTLLMLCQGYIWEDIKYPANLIPAVLAKNIYSICKRDQRFPTPTYADYILNNWQLKNPQQPITLDNVKPLFTFTGSKDEAWFIIIHVVIEAVSGKALHAAYQGYLMATKMHANPARYLTTGNQKKLAAILNQIASALKNATSVLKKLKDGCNPDYYWSVIRHYLMGWNNVKIFLADSKEEQGVKFEGVMSKDKTLGYIYTGASGAQSGVIPAIDAALGVEQEIDSMYQTLITQEQYMPIEHQLFVDLMKLSKIKKVVMIGEESALKDAWRHALGGLKSFRGEHLKLVEYYIYHPAAKEGIVEATATGTGGSPIKSYLVSRYQATDDTANRLDN